MDLKHKKLLGYFIAGTALVTGGGAYYRGYQQRVTLAQAAEVASTAPMASPRGQHPGLLLSMQAPDQEIARSRDRVAGRSPAVDSDSTREENFEKLTREFLEQPAMAAENERLAEYFPDGKGVNRSIRLALIFANLPVEGENAFANLSLATRAQAEVFAHAESSLTSLDQGLAKLPREASADRLAAIRMLSNLGGQNSALRDEVKVSLLREAARAETPSEGALVFAALLRVNTAKSWQQEISRSFAKLHPGTELSEFVALNVVAL